MAMDLSARKQFHWRHACSGVGSYPVVKQYYMVTWHSIDSELRRGHEEKLLFFVVNLA